MTTAAAEPPGLGTWQTATVVRVRQETPAAKTFTLKLPEPRPFWAGQHFIVRLTAPGGYRAQRCTTPPRFRGRTPRSAAPDGHVCPPGRLMAEDLASAMAEERDVYVCGSTAFCDAATRLIASAGVPSERIKVERFGFSG